MTANRALSGLLTSAFVLVFVTVSGCARSPSRVELPGFPAGAGAAALEEYDTNKDGKISGAELAKAASLKAALEQLDVNSDKAITADEIDGRIAQWRQQKVALMPVACKVLVNGSPAVNATVTFQPETFLGGTLYPATGVTDEEGIASVKLAPEHVSDPKFAAFLPPGLYKITAEVGGKKYTLGPRTGCEVASESSWAGDGIIIAEFESR